MARARGWLCSARGRGGPELPARGVCLSLGPGHGAGLSLSHWREGAVWREGVGGWALQATKRRLHSVRPLTSSVFPLFSSDLGNSVTGVSSVILVNVWRSLHFPS